VTKALEDKEVEDNRELAVELLVALVVEVVIVVLAEQVLVKELLWIEETGTHTLHRITLHQGLVHRISDNT
jgi:hypothetical protein